VNVGVRWGEGGLWICLIHIEQCGFQSVQLLHGLGGLSGHSELLQLAVDISHNFWPILSLRLARCLLRDIHSRFQCSERGDRSGLLA